MIGDLAGSNSKSCNCCCPRIRMAWLHVIFVRTQHSECHPVSPLGEIETRRSYERAPRKYLFTVHGQRGSAPETSAIPLCRVPHSKQSGETAKYRPALQIGEDQDQKSVV